MRLIKIVIFTFIAALVITGCTPAKFETRTMDDGYGPKIILTNTSKTNKYEFTIKDVQTIVHYPKNGNSYKEIGKTETKKRALNPGEQKSVGRSEYNFSWNQCYNHEGCKSYHEYKVVGYLKINP